MSMNDFITGLLLFIIIGLLGKIGELRQKIKGFEYKH